MNIDELLKLEYAKAKKIIQERWEEAMKKPEVREYWRKIIERNIEREWNATGPGYGI